MVKLKTVMGIATKAALEKKGAGDSQTPEVHSGHVISNDTSGRGRNMLDAMSGKIHTITVREVNPSRCKMWEFHNRIYSKLTEEYCADLINGFKEQGQIRPAIVRKIEHPEYDFEIISGARRHWTATYLKRDLLVEVRSLDDEEAFLLSDADNKDGKDISDYERALEYKETCDRLYGGNQAKLAQRVAINEDRAGEYIALADLDKEIVEAYGDTRELKTYHAAEYRKIVRKAKGMKPPEAKATLLKEARRIGKLPDDSKERRGPEVLKALQACLTKPRTNGKVIPYKSKKGKKMLTVKISPRGIMEFKIEKDSGATQGEVMKVLQTHLADYFE